MTDFLDVYFFGAVFVLGAIIGSFLNVVIYRFHTGRSINIPSHCLSCQKRLRWFELIPLVSYLVLSGRCRSCRAYIPPRYFLVELATALGFLTLYRLQEDLFLLFLWGVLFAILMVVVVYDIYHMVIPNELVVVVGGVTLLIVGYGTYFSGAYGELVWNGVASLIAFGFYGGLWKISKGRWIGFGDAKLAIPLGFIVGTQGVLSLIVFSFWIGAVVSLVVISIPYLRNIWGRTIQKFYSSAVVAKYPRYFTIKSEVPFAPFLVLSFCLVYFYGADVLVVMSYVL